LARPENEPLTPLAKRLRKIREVLGNEGREQFSARLKLPKNTLANYERGLYEPTASVIAAYNLVYGVNLHWIITGEGEIFGNATDALHLSAGLLNRALLESAIEAVYEGLGDNVLSPQKMVEIILIAYDMLVQDPDNKNNIIRLVRAG